MKASPTALPDEIIEEILLRLPPDDPACILRASVVCKAWSSAVSHPSFRRCLHELHGVPPVLGFIRKWDIMPKHTPGFIPTTASSFSIAAPDYHTWWALDYRHGRAIFLSKDQDTEELLVWEPITGSKQFVRVPAMFQGSHGTAAVFCAADLCDHRDCQGGPYQLDLVINVYVNYYKYDTLACVYSSETGTWGKPTSVSGIFYLEFINYSSVLVGTSLLYFMSDEGFVVEYDLARHDLTVFDALDIEPLMEEPERLNLVLSEDGGMRVTQELYPHLKFWKREASNPPDAQWVLSRVINLGTLFQIGVLPDEGTRVRVAGFAEGANVIFIETDVGLFTIELKSEHVRKVSDDGGLRSLIPVVNFYTPVQRDDHQDVPLSSRS